VVQEQKVRDLLVQNIHNILEPVLERLSDYNAKHCSKSLLKKDFIPF
jgi:hypothetical protein